MPDNWHAAIESFEVEPDGQHVIMTTLDPDGQHVTVRATKDELTTMTDAQPFYSDGPPQTPTTRPVP